MPQALRAFVAVPIPDAVAAFLKEIQRRLQSPGMSIRWVSTRNIHLTLKFLGDIDPARVPAVAARMDAVAGSTPCFSLKAMGVGVFPNLRNARVLWVGLGGDLHRLRTVQENLASSLESVGFSRETRRFRPHLTVGRTRQRICGETIGASLEPLKEVESDLFRVEKLMLMNSILKPAGAEYALLHTSHLTIQKNHDVS